MSGDPFAMRDTVLRNAMQWQRRFTHEATASFIEFQYSINQAIGPMDISRNSPQGKDNLKALFSHIHLAPEPEQINLQKRAVIDTFLQTGGTYGVKPLTYAKEWLDPANGHTQAGRKKAIVIVSDGQLGDGRYAERDTMAIVRRSDGILDTTVLLSWEKQLELKGVKTWKGDPAAFDLIEYSYTDMSDINTAYPDKMPTVYALNIGHEGNDPSNQILAGLTGGKAWTVPPEDTDSLMKIMVEIIGYALEAVVPRTVTVTNLSLDTPQVSVARYNAELEVSDLAPTGEDGWSVRLDSIVRLDPGANRIRVVRESKNFRTAEIDIDTVEFSIDVGGGNEMQYVTCYDTTSLAIIPQDPTGADIMSNSDTYYAVRLRTHSWDLADGLNPAIGRTLNLGDRVTLDVDSSAKYSLESRRRFTIAQADVANTSDLITQSAGKDTLTVKWEHPRDPADTASAVIRIRDMTLEPPIAIPAPGVYDTFQLTVSVTDNNRHMGGASVYLSTDGGATFAPYGAPLTLSSLSADTTITLKAYAAASGYLNSDTTDYVYSLRLRTLPPPTAFPLPGTFEEITLPVTLRDTSGTPGVTIQYRLGGDPYGRYTQPIALGPVYTPTDFTVSAYTAAPGYRNSPEVGFTYHFDPRKLPPPKAAPDSGTHETPLLSVTLRDESGLDGVGIRYSLDGTHWQTGAGPIALGPVTSDTAIDLRAYSTKQGWLDSDTAVLRFRLRLPKAPMPVAAPNGGSYYGSVLVILTTPLPEATIWYTLDGTDPIPGVSPRYSAPIGIDSSEPVVLKAVTQRTGYKVSDVMVATFTNLDPDGPVISRAQFYLGNTSSGSGTSTNDTLVISFNEPVSCEDLDQTAVALFRYVDADDILSEIEVLGSAHAPGTCLGTSRSVEFLVPPEGNIVPLEDALQLEPWVARDQYGNTNELTDPVVIEWGRRYPAVVKAQTLFNPVVDPIPPGVLRRVGAGPAGPPPAKGTFVSVFAVQGLDMASTKMAVYDAVGNLIQNGLPAYGESYGGKRFWFFWDGVNLRGRTVGTGTYLAVIRLVLRDDTETVERIRLGVRR